MRDKYTMQELKELAFFEKVKNDRFWYINNFLYIRNKEAQLVKFKFNEAQKQFIDIMRETEKEGKLHRYIVLKARQMGISTLAEGLIFSNTSTNPNVNSLIIAHEDKATQNLFNMSKLFYEELPDAIRPMKKYSNEKALSFENPTNDDAEKKKNPGLRSKITVATAGTQEAGRSATIHNLHVSELAFFPNPETSMLALLQSVPNTRNSMVILESTANGVGDYFHRMWQQAVRGENNFIPVFLPWFTDSSYTMPFRSSEEREAFIKEVDETIYENGKEMRTEEYYMMEKFGLTYEQLNWRRYIIANNCNGDVEKFMQEYPSTAEEAFIASGRPKFSVTALREYAKKTKKGVRGYLEYTGSSVDFIEDEQGYIEIWDMPERDTFYCIGADVAEGLKSGDYSCALVGDEEFNVVAKWHGHIDPDLFGLELVKLAMFYNDAYLGVESNNHGLTTLKAIQNEEYWNIYYMKTYDRITDQMTSKLGWQTNRRTKPLMINKLAEFIRESYLTIPSELVIDEAFTYVIEDNGSTNAQQGCHDDSIMALAILLQLLLEGRGDEYVPEIPDEKKKRGIFGKQQVIDPLFEGHEIEQEVAE